MVKVGVADSSKYGAVVVVVLSMYDSDALCILTPPPTYLASVYPITRPTEIMTATETAEVVVLPMIIKNKKKIFQPSMVKY